MLDIRDTFSAQSLLCHAGKSPSRRPSFHLLSIRHNSRVCCTVLLLCLSAVICLITLGVAQLAHADEIPASTAQVLPSVRMSRSYGWQILDTHRFILWLGVEEPYLITLSASCPALPTLAPAGATITTHDRRLHTKLDGIRIDRTFCPIDTIQQLKHDSAQGHAPQRSAAQPLAISPFRATLHPPKIGHKPK